MSERDDVEGYVGASLYLIGALERVAKGKVVRDLDEAWAAHEAALQKVPTPHSRDEWLVIWMEGDWQSSKRFLNHGEALTFANSHHDATVIPTPTNRS